MEAWLGELRPYAGEPDGSAGWRLAKAGWRLVRGQWTILQLVFLLSALWTLQTYWLVTAGLRWGGGDGALILLINSGAVLGATFLLGAIATCVDAALDGEALDLSMAWAETRERLGPLLGWGVASLVALIVLVQLGRSLDASALGVIALIVWYLLTFFAIPLAVLAEMGPASAWRQSLRLVRDRRRESFAAFAGLGVFGLLALVPGTMLLTHAAAVHNEHGGVPHLLLALALFVAFLGVNLAAAAKEAFAVMIVREEIDELSPREYAGPRRSRPAKFLRFCGGVALVFFVVGVMAAIDKHDRAVVKEASSPGSTYTTEVASYGTDLPSGAPVLYGTSKIGEVLGSEQDGSYLRIRFHVEPGFSPTATPGELVVQAAGDSPCLVIVPTGEALPDRPQF
jgi:hypothetical protein